MEVFGLWCYENHDIELSICIPANQRERGEGRRLACFVAASFTCIYIASINTRRIPSFSFLFSFQFFPFLFYFFLLNSCKS